MGPCGRARLHTSRGAMAILAWKFPRTRLPVGASALCVVVLCWLYVFPVYRLPNEKEIIQGVLAQRTAWRRNQTAARVFRILACFIDFNSLEELVKMDKDERILVPKAGLSGLLWEEQT